MNKRLIFPVMILALVLNLLVLDVSTIYSSNNRTALVVGNGSYKSAPLKNPVNDAEDMAKVLRETGFNVTLKLNATQREMKEAVKAFGKELRNGGVGLFYYAGHGIQLQGRNYLIPVKADIVSESDVEYEALDAGRVLGKMEDAGNDLNIVILDACRDNPFKRSFRSSAKGLAKMDAPTGSLVAYATAPGAVASDGDGRNGLYTRYLIRHMRTPGLKVEDVFKQVRIAVLKETGKKQTPWESSSLAGDFYFIKGDQKAAAVSKSQPAVKEQITIKPSARPENQAPPDINALLARAESEKAREEKLKREKQQKIEQQKRVRQERLEKEKLRKTELVQQLEKYDLLVKEYGDQYKDQAWQAICADFPMLTKGLKPGNTFGLKIKAGVIKPGDVRTEPLTGMEFVLVEGGCFQMGDTFGGGDDDERPVHRVCVDSFWMGKYEVTQGQWQKIMGDNPSHFRKGENYPVEQVSWNDCRAFIRKLNSRSGRNFRLPYEAEWEYAARSGGKNEKYSGGNSIDRVAWYRSNSGNKTHPVGTKAPNGLGIYDMSGNVWEWCGDWYGKDYYRNSPQDNPQGPPSGSYRVIRSGSWNYGPGSVRAAYRYGYAPVNRNGYLGFRLLLPSGQ